MERIARVFLTTGKCTGVDLETLSRECNRIVRRETEKSASRAIELGRQFVRRAEQYGGEMAATACRALGWAYLVAGKFHDAHRTYLKARDLVKRDALARARVDRVLIDVCMYLGDLKQARRHARLAMNTFEKQHAESDLAKTKVNYANLLHRQDRHREAGRLYAQAADFFDAQGNDLAVAFCLYNRANTLVQLFDFDEAASLYRRAHKIFIGHDHHLRANGCQYGLAWLHMLEGNFHVALQELAECEDSYRKASQDREVVLCQLDRAEVFLGLNLFSDAREMAREAERKARKLGIKYEAAKAALFYAKASVGIGRKTDARGALKRAEDDFARENNKPFLAAVHLAQAQINDGKSKRMAELEHVGRKFSQVQLPLWEAICDLQLLAARPDDARPLKKLRRNKAVKTVPHLFACWQTILGDREAERHRIDAAVDHWNRAADLLDAVRAKLPPVDMRSAFSRRNTDPHRRLVQVEAGRDPVVASCWAERLKTAGIWSVPDDAFEANPARSRALESLSQLADQAAALSWKISESAGRRAAVRIETNKILEKLQRKVRQDLAIAEKPDSRTADSLGNLRRLMLEASMQRTVVQFHLNGDDVYAFVHERGATRCHRYRGGARMVGQLMGRWRFMVERAPFASGRPSVSDLQDEHRLLADIGAWLWSPLEISRRREKLLILPEGRLSNLPWSAIVNGGEALVVSHDLVISPSLRHYLHAQAQKSRSKQIRVFVGNTDGLSQARQEYAPLVAAGNGEVLINDPCRRSDWPDAGAARVWHYTGHAQLRGDNPFYSSLILSDGPIFAADFRLKRNRVGLVTLAACRTGEQAYQAGEESSGLVRSFMEMGARNVVASHWAVSDRATAYWMKKFYDRYLSGRSAGRAAREAAIQVREKYPSAYHWAAFSVYGAG